MVASADLGSPPEFRPDGGDPPLTSPPILIVDRLAPVTVARERSPRDVARLAVRRITAGLAGLSISIEPDRVVAGPQAVGAPSDDFRTYTELRRFRSSMYWEREPQTIQLAPGASTERSIRFTVGLSLEQTREFADALSAKAGADLKALQAEISETWTRSVGESVAFQTAEEHVESLGLKNDNRDPNIYRRFAIWKVVHEYAVDRLDGIELTRSFDPDELEQLRNIPAVWTAVGQPIKAIGSNTVVMTSIDVRRSA
jgi:hypothetical protein